MWKEWRKIADRPLKILDAAVWFVVAGTTLFYALYWKYMPGQVPLHWNGAGEIDNYGGAGSYIMLIIMMYFFLAWHVLSKIIPVFAGKENFFGKQLAEKAAAEDLWAGKKAMLYMLWWCDLVVEGVLAYIIVCGSLLKNLGAWFLPLVFIALAADMIWFFRKMKQLKEKIKKRRMGQMTQDI